MNCVDKIENKLQHISDKILFTWDMGYMIWDFAIAGLAIGNCRYFDRTDVQLSTPSGVFQIQLDSI